MLNRCPNASERQQHITVQKPTKQNSQKAQNIIYDVTRLLWSCAVCALRAETVNCCGFTTTTFACTSNRFSSKQQRHRGGKNSGNRRKFNFFLDLERFGKDRKVIKLAATKSRSAVPLLRRHDMALHDTFLTSRFTAATVVKK